MSNEGKKVKVHYTGTLDDGTKFDSSLDRGEPIEFTCMAGMMIPGFDAAVKDMQAGETKTVHIPAADAYGERREDLVQKVPVNQIPNGENLPVGQTIYMQGPGDSPSRVRRRHRGRRGHVRHEPRTGRQGPELRDHPRGGRRLGSRLARAPEKRAGRRGGTGLATQASQAHRRPDAPGAGRVPGARVRSAPRRPASGPRPSSPGHAQLAYMLA